MTLLFTAGCYKHSSVKTASQIADTYTPNVLAKNKPGYATLYVIPQYNQNCFIDCPAKVDSYVFLQDHTKKYTYLATPGQLCYYVKPGQYNIVSQNIGYPAKTIYPIRLQAHNAYYLSNLNTAGHTLAGPKISLLLPQQANYYVHKLTGGKKESCVTIDPIRGYGFRQGPWLTRNPIHATSLNDFSYQYCKVSYENYPTQQCQFGFLSMTSYYSYTPTNKKCPQKIGDTMLWRTIKGEQYVKSAHCWFGS